MWVVVIMYLRDNIFVKFYNFVWLGWLFFIYGELGLRIIGLLIGFRSVVRGSVFLVLEVYFSCRVGSKLEFIFGFVREDFVYNLI